MNDVKKYTQRETYYVMKNPGIQIQFPHREKKTVVKSINLIGNLEKLIYD